MHRLLTITTVIMMLVGITACGSSKSDVSVDNGAFTCTPQELIDSINATVKAANNDELYAIGDFAGDGEELQISGTALTLTLDQNGDGNLQHVKLYWYSGDGSGNVLASAGYYMQAILNQLTPSDATDIGNSIQSAFTSGGKIERQSGDVKVTYGAFGAGGNEMDVSIVS